MNWAVKLTMLAMAVYAVLLALVYVFQPRMVYFPAKGDYGMTPKSLGLAFEAVTLATDDGEKLAAWWVPAAGAARGTVLLFHGNAGNIAHRIDYAAMFSGMGYHTLLVDYRGYGMSSGEPSEQGTYLDAQAAWTWLTSARGVNPSGIVIFGESLGGGPASWLAARQPAGGLRALILASAFTSIPDLGAQLYPWLPVRWLSRIHYDNLSNLTKVRAPLLVAHSPGDEIIPHAHGRRLFAAAREPKAFLELRGGHNEGFVFSRDEWRKAISAFLARYEM